MADTSFNAQLSIGNSHGTEAQLSIIDAAIDPPYEAYAAHVGQGVLLLTWKHDEPERVDHYEVLIASSLGGVYQLASRFTDRRGTIRNVPIGFSVYLKIIAVGINTAVSTVAQFTQGLLQQQDISMQVRGIEGSEIPKDAIFTSVDSKTGSLIAIAANERIVL